MSRELFILGGAGVDVRESVRHQSALRTLLLPPFNQCAHVSGAVHSRRGGVNVREPARLQPAKRTVLSAPLIDAAESRAPFISGGALLPRQETTLRT